MSTIKEKSSGEVSLPNSRKVFVEGKQSGVRVPFREIALHPTKNFNGAMEENDAVRVYDASGAWGDPSVHCDVSEGLPALRREWMTRSVIWNPW